MIVFSQKKKKKKLNLLLGKCSFIKDILFEIDQILALWTYKLSYTTNDVIRLPQ